MTETRFGFDFVVVVVVAARRVAGSAEADVAVHARRDGV